MAMQTDFEIKQQNISGAGHFYVEPQHRSFVVEVEVTSDVRGDILQEAVNDVLARAPYFADAFVERDGDFFYAVNPLPFEVAEGGLRAVGGPETNWHNIDVTYQGNKISFAMFHALCDGLGMNLFIEAVLNRYYCRKDGKDYPAEGLRVPGQPMLDGEEEDPFARRYELPEDFQPGALGEPCYHLPEVDDGPLDHMRCVNFRMREAEFMELVKSCQSSPVATLQVLMANAVLDVHPDIQEMIGATVLASSRKACGTPNTFKNALNALVLPYRRFEMDGLGFADRCHLSRQLLLEANNPCAARHTANILGGIVAQASQTMHGYAEKAQALNFAKGANNDSYVIDYVGGLRSTGFEDQIASVHYKATNLAEGFRTPTLYLTATAGYFDIELVRGFESDIYVDAFAEQLKAHGIVFTRGDEESYVTPENGFLSALGLI